MPSNALKPVPVTADVGTERSYQRLAAAIQALIGSGEFEAGDRLPSERALAERFDVSRTAVREAIIALEQHGAVEVRGGSGIYVCAPQPAGAGPVALSLRAAGDGPGPFELLRARCLIESEVAALAATTRQDADLDHLYAALSDMRRYMHDKARNEAADREFHLRIARSTGNSVLLQTVTAMWDHARGPIWTRADRHFHTAELRRASHADHQRIFEALLERDAAAAKAAMQAHLERVIAEFARAWR